MVAVCYLFLLFTCFICTLCLIATVFSFWFVDTVQMWRSLLDWPNIDHDTCESSSSVRRWLSANPLTRSEPFLSLLGRSNILVKSTENQSCHVYFRSWFWPVVGANSSTSQPVPSGNPLSPISRLLWGVTWHWTPAIRGTLTAQQ